MLLSVAVLLAMSFSFEAAICILAWSTGDIASLQGASLGSFIVAHMQWLALAADVAVGRVPVPAVNVVWPITLFAIYVFAGGMYAVAQGRAPYAQLNGHPSRTIAAVFIALAIILCSYALLWAVVRVRENAVARRAGLRGP